MSTPYIYQIGYTHCINVCYAVMVIKMVYYRWGYEYKSSWGCIFKKYYFVQCELKYRKEKNVL